MRRLTAGGVNLLKQRYITIGEARRGQSHASQTRPVGLPSWGLAVNALPGSLGFFNREYPDYPYLPSIQRYEWSLKACLALSPKRLVDPRMRTSNEGLLRLRIARAQKIIRLHPLLCSASRRTTRQPLLPFHTRMPSAFANVTGGARYPPRLSRDGRLELTKAPRSQDRGCGNSRRFPPGEAR